MAELGIHVAQALATRDGWSISAISPRVAPGFASSTGLANDDHDLPPLHEVHADSGLSLVHRRYAAMIQATSRDSVFFTDAMKAGAGNSVFVYVRTNLRGSSLAGLYRTIRDGAPVQDAAAKLTGVWCSIAACNNSLKRRWPMMEKLPTSFNPVSRLSK